MTWFTGIVLYVLIWWTTLFTVLPWGIKRDTEERPDRAHGAPVNPQLKRKFVITAGISVVIWLMVYLLIEIEVINFYEEAERMMKEDDPK